MKNNIWKKKTMSDPECLGFAYMAAGFPLILLEIVGKENDAYWAGGGIFIIGIVVLLISRYKNSRESDEKKHTANSPED